MSEHYVEQCHPIRTRYGLVTKVMVYRLDMRPMYYRELYDVLQLEFPRRQWLQLGPLPEHLLDNANKYHVALFEEGADLSDFDMMASDTSDLHKLERAYADVVRQRDEARENNKLLTSRLVQLKQMVQASYDSAISPDAKAILLDAINDTLNKAEGC